MGIGYTEGAFDMKTAIVSGSLGSIGAALVTELVNRRVKVYALVRAAGDPRIAQRLPKEANIIACDMQEYGALPEMIHEPVDAFFHLAWAGTSGSALLSTLPLTFKGISSNLTTNEGTIYSGFCWPT